MPNYWLESDGRCFLWPGSRCNTFGKKAFQTDEILLGAGRLAVLGHPVRLAMVRELVWAAVIHNDQPPPGSGGAVAGLLVAELAARLGMKRAAVGNHLPQMLNSGLVRMVPEATGGSVVWRWQRRRQ